MFLILRQIERVSDSGEVVVVRFRDSHGYSRLFFGRRLLTSRFGFGVSFGFFLLAFARAGEALLCARHNPSKSLKNIDEAEKQHQHNTEAQAGYNPCLCGYC